MDIVDVGLCKIGKLFPYALQVSGEIIDVEHHAQQLSGLIPVGTFLLFRIPLLQRIPAFF